MVIHHIAYRLPSLQRVEIELRKFERPGDAAVDVVALLKVDVLEEVAANRPRENGVAIPIDAPPNCGIAPSTGIRRLRRYSSIVGLHR
jgi:hypothetical protein